MYDHDRNQEPSGSGQSRPPVGEPVKDPVYYNLKQLGKAGKENQAFQPTVGETEIELPEYTNFQPQPEANSKKRGSGKDKSAKKDYVNEDVINEISKSHRDLSGRKMSAKPTEDEPKGNYMVMTGSAETPTMEDEDGLQDYYNVDGMGYKNPGLHPKK